LLKASLSSSDILISEENPTSTLCVFIESHLGHRHLLVILITLVELLHLQPSHTLGHYDLPKLKQNLGHQEFFYEVEINISPK
jgi:hypothetical protein